MTKQMSWFVLLVSTLVLIITVFLTPKNINNGFNDDASILTFITGAAVAIERIIEAFWTFVGGILGSYWPLNAINKQVSTLVSELDIAMIPFQEEAKNALDKAATTNDSVKVKLGEAKNEIDRLKDRFDEIKSLAPDNQRVQLLAAAANQNVSYLSEKYKDILPNLEMSVLIANTTINGLQDFLASFKDNPGRRLISIYIGACIGVIIAGNFGLDLFKAVLKDLPNSEARVIVTGIVIGLGASPTHEVIRAVQEYKKSRKGENISKPDLPS